TLFHALGASDIHHWDGPQGAGHVMGTCRMGHDPKSSVVDKQLRVHGHPNCFVLGTAVFPTVGTANPTITVAALSLRAVGAIKASLRYPCARRCGFAQSRDRMGPPGFEPGTDGL